MSGDIITIQKYLDENGTARLNVADLTQVWTGHSGYQTHLNNNLKEWCMCK